MRYRFEIKYTIVYTNINLVSKDRGVCDLTGIEKSN